MDSETLNLINIILKRNKVFLADATVMSSSTNRQIMYRLEKINDFLLENNLRGIEIGDSKEFLVDEDSQHFLLDYLYDQDYFTNYFLNRDERKHFIYLMLFINQEYLSIQHLVSALKVSKSTLLIDLKELSEFLSEDGIIIENDRTRGYYLIGSERSIRKVMMNIILDYVTVKHNFRLLNLFIYVHQLESLDSLKGIIESLADKYEIVFVEDRLIEFIYIFIMTKSRISQSMTDSNLYNDIPYIDLMYKFKEYDFTRELMLLFFKDSIQEHEIDIQYLTSWVLGTSVGNVEESSADLLVIGELVGKIVNRFEIISGIKFEDVETIFRHVYSHFRPAYYRIIFRHPVFNPLTDRIITEYNDLYKLVEETMRPVSESLEFEIPKEEIAYLTLHFSSQYKEIKTMKLSKKKGLVVCLNGVGSSVMLYNDLRKMFPEFEFYKPLEASNININDYNPDIIFTTDYFKELRDLNVPIIKVSPVMDSLTRYQIIQEARLKLGLEISDSISIEGILNVVKQHFGEIKNESKLKSDILNVLMASKNETIVEEDGSLSFIDMISKDAIFLDIDSKDWKEIMTILGEPLIKNDYVTPGYIDNIISMHSSIISSFIISDNIAIPHTHPNLGAKKHAFSIGVLKEPVIFDEVTQKPIKYIFCLSAPDNYGHINAMTEFLDLIKDEEFIGVLENSNSVKNVVKYIECKSFDN